MYDATDYAVNTFNVPVVAYSGGNDAQKQAADAMAAAMLKEGLTLEHIVGPNTGHAYEPHARQQVQDRLDQLVATGRNAVPKEIRFTTWMLRYNTMFWLTVDAMAEEWQRARVDARIDANTVTVTTANVTALHLDFDQGTSPFGAGTRPQVKIDGETRGAAAGRRDALVLGRVDQEGRDVASRSTASRRVAQAAWSPGTDRRRVHGQLRVRASDGTAVIGRARAVGAGAG